MILGVLYTFNTFTSSTLVAFPEPILRVPPIETVLGILSTNISSTTPLELPVDIVFPRPTLSVLTPTWNVLVRFNMDVFKPDMITEL